MSAANIFIHFEKSYNFTPILLSNDPFREKKKKFKSIQMGLKENFSF